MEIDFATEQCTHAALAQYYRWYQVYEVPFTNKRIENQKDILSDDVEIITHVGTTNGKDGLEERLSVYQGWLNAHHVQHTEVKQVSEHELSLEADIIYQNIRPDQSRSSYTIHYSAILQVRKNDLPVFTKLKLNPVAEIKDFTFQSAYAENRCKSFLHYWMYLMGTMSHPNSLFKELIANDFSLKIGDEKERHTFEDFTDWMNTETGTVSKTHYQYKNLIVTEREEDVFAVSVQLTGKRMDSVSKEIVHVTKQEWIFSNNKDERFARMQHMRIFTTA